MKLCIFHFYEIVDSISKNVHFKQQTISDYFLVMVKVFSFDFFFQCEEDLHNIGT